MWSKALSASAFAATTHAVSVSVASEGGNATSPYAYGFMFEDINNSGDGGIYAELVHNRAFQGDPIYPRSLDYWNSLGGAGLSLRNLSKPLSSALPTSMQVSADNATSDTIGFSNEGFWGFPVVSGWQYNGSFWVYGGLDGNITICLSSYDDKVFAETSVEVSSTSEWTQYNYTLNPSESAPDSNNTLNFTFASSDLKDSVNFNLLSLLPPTYNDRPNGLRIDLMDAIDGLYPSFFRMPGGNNMEGLQSPYWWNWTNTIGPLTQRPGYPGTWDYENTNGLGLIEYLLWAQDLGMEPMLGVWAGLWLDGEIVLEDDLQVYVQSALDELEFLMGDASTEWGSYRESLGYGPFEIGFVEIGNEDSLNDGAPSYAAYRFQAFHDAIRNAYPDITIIASYFDVKGSTPPDNAAGDFHQYAAPQLMSSEFGFFDNYTSEHPVVIGEYAVTYYPDGDTTRVGQGNFAPYWQGSVAEAIFLLGAERNSDKIIGSAYAPSFQNLNRWEWIPDLIEFDANPEHTTMSTSWEMIHLLSGTRITENLPMTITDGGFGPAYFVAGRSNDTGSHIAKFAVYNATSDVPFQLNFDGVSSGATANLTYLTAPMNASNPIGGSIVEKHTDTVTAGDDGTISFQLPPYSVAVLEVGADNAGKSKNYSGHGSRHGWQGCRSFGKGGSHKGSWGKHGHGWQA
ncbi:putative vacuolar segregation protein [Hortaea werneckii]|nr:putative vacuolar segregation protein [Hortaea werneckii]